MTRINLRRWWVRYRAKVLLGALALVITVPVGLIARRALGVWGIFNPIGDELGGWLRQHVSPSQAEWTLTALLSLILYGAALKAIWRTGVSTLTSGSQPAVYEWKNVAESLEQFAGEGLVAERDRCRNEWHKRYEQKEETQ